MSEYSAQGEQGLKEAVNERIAETSSNERIYVYSDRAGNVIASNIGSMPVTTGHFEGAILVGKGSSSVDTESYFYGEAKPIKDGTLFVGRDARAIEDTLETLLAAFSLGTAGATIAALALGAVLGRISARRIETISRTTHDIVTKDLSGRVPVRRPGDELDALSNDINSMLDRINGLMESIRQIASDVAHDLRMPLTRLKQQLELELCDDHPSTRSRKRRLKIVIAEAEGIIETFNSLLRIAEIEGGMRKSGFKTTSLSDVLLDLHEIYEPVAQERQHQLTTDIEREISISGDHELLTQLFANLVENGLRYAPPGGRIHIRLCKLTTHIEAAIVDNGPGIPLNERDKVFRRLYRMERNRTTPGSGLGLSLVAAIADLHEAVVELADNDPGLRVLVRFANNDGCARGSPI